ncbi:MAG: hypothetical protein JSS35_11225, partial [Proteobacteria bacterium]|nr:hypothetical protein [Pseudomonadota bacterium]
MTDRDDAELVIEALYQVAANPAAWEQLVAALDPEGLENAPAAAAAELRRTAEIARLQAGPGEGAGAAGGQGVGWVVLGAAGRVLACDPTGREALAGVGGRVEADGALRFRDPVNEEAARA